MDRFWLDNRSMRGMDRLRLDNRIVGEKWTGYDRTIGSRERNGQVTAGQ